MRRFPKAYYISVYLVLILVYIGVVLWLPSNVSAIKQYHLTPLALHLLTLTVILPVIAIWTAAFYAFLKLSRYGHRISGDPDGKAINKIATGVGVVAFASPIANTVNTILSHYTIYNHNLIPRSTIIGNYLGLAIPLIGFLFISYGARDLSNIVKKRPSSFTIQFFGIIFLLISSIYVYLLFHNIPAISHLRNGVATGYYLPNWLLLGTIAVPYIFMWFVGFIAALDLYVYRFSVKGKIYKAGINYLSTGLGVTVVGYVASQYIVSLSAKLLALKLSAILLVLYPLIIVILAGYLLIAYGSRKLSALEEV